MCLIFGLKVLRKWVLSQIKHSLKLPIILKKNAIKKQMSSFQGYPIVGIDKIDSVNPNSNIMNQERSPWNQSTVEKDLG